MNNIALWIYLVGTVDGMRTMLIVTGILSGIVAMVSIMAYFDLHYLRDVNSIRKIGWLCVVSTILLIVNSLVYVVIPDSKTLSAMIVIPKVVENPRIANIGDKSLSILEEKVQQWLESVKLQVPAEISPKK